MLGNQLRMDRRHFLRAGAGGILSTFGVTAAGCVSDTSSEAEEGDTMTEYDVFVVAGQSNAVGKGSSTDSPDVQSGAAYEYKSTTDELVHLDDPVGQDNSPETAADTGSAWPAFADEFYTQTGREAVYVPYSQGGSGQHPDTRSDPDLLWSSGGNLYYNARDKLQEAITFLEDQGHLLNIWGAVWLQGERDAGEIDNGVITKSQYKSALNDHIDRWQSDIASDFRFFIAQIGHENGGDTQGYKDVRAAQSEVANSREHVHMVSTIQKNFPEEGKMKDTWHYTQTGLNETGVEAGGQTASIVEANAPNGRALTNKGVLETSNAVIQTE